MVPGRDLPADRRLREIGVESPAIAVNLSARQFQEEGLGTSLTRILAETKVDPALIQSARDHSQGVDAGSRISDAQTTTSVRKRSPDSDRRAAAAAQTNFVTRSARAQAVPTGLALEIPAGYEVQIRPRSGLALKHAITLPNSPATIDPGYRGELKVILLNLGRNAYEIQPGDRIAQLVVARYEPVEWEEGELAESVRGIGGFGSSGR